MSGSGQVSNKSGSERAEKEDRSWRRLLGDRGFVKMESIGCVYMLKETVGCTRGEVLTEGMGICRGAQGRGPHLIAGGGRLSRYSHQEATALALECRAGGPFLAGSVAYCRCR